MNYNNEENKGHGSEVRHEGHEGEELQQPFASSDDERSEEYAASAEVEQGDGKPIFGPEVIQEIEGALTGDYLPAPRPKAGRPKGRKDSRKFTKRGRPGEFSSEDGTSPVNRVEIEVIGEDGPKKKQIGHESSSDS